MAAPSGVFWTLWKERNSRVFDNVEGSVDQLKDSLLRSIYLWCSEDSDGPLVPSNSFVDFVNSFNLD